MLIQYFIVLCTIFIRMNVVFCPLLLLCYDIDKLLDLVSCIHVHRLLVHKFIIELGEILKGLIKQMGVEELSVLALSENWHFLTFELPLDNAWL